MHVIPFYDVASAAFLAIRLEIYQFVQWRMANTPNYSSLTYINLATCDKEGWRKVLYSVKVLLRLGRFTHLRQDNVLRLQIY